jgi:sugar lactone lactonase YvrE
VQSVRHQLRVQHPHGTLQQARKKMPLFVGDLIQTSSKDAAAIRFCDGGTLYLNQQSEVVFSSPSQEQERYGEVAERLSQHSTHRVQTATATATGSGARFDVATRRGTSTFVVAHGVVQVENGHGRVRVAANQQTVVLPDRAPQPPARSDARRALSWTASVSGPSWKVVATFDPSYRPQRLEVNAQGFLYVVLIPPNGSQPADARIVKLSPNGKQVASWGLHAKDGELYGLGLDAQSNVYATDTTHAQIEQFTPDGRFLRTIGPVGHDLPQFVRLHGVEVDAAGNLYVAASGSNLVQKLSPSDQLRLEVGGSGSVPGRLNGPDDVAVDKAGNFYLAEYVNGRVQKFSPGGQALKTFGTGAMEAPADVALDAAGNIYVCEPPRQYIRELSPSGQTLKLWSSLRTSVGYLGRPTGVALDAASTMYVADYDRHRILKLVR